MAKRIGQLCRDLLPAEFERSRRLAAAVQTFLDTQLPEPLAGAVTLLTADDQEFHVAADSPPLANYLRLYRAEIELQLNEAFGRPRRLQIRTMPAAATRLAPVAAPPPPRPVGAAALEALERSARCVEDDALRESVLALARAIRDTKD